ncbi:hypothetical protein C791_0547 [Amycolatopsis azurea DSM 43854]|uniref:Uncharacterized protein n=1 Tax=Amycolatopsis azurea DSM 43854 TaxID=1238180 RepID=M2PR93_9PSEU|nr:hypothetical protein C791_0547 [Amycolatopsis azurea DSM 43854]
MWPNGSGGGGSPPPDPLHARALPVALSGVRPVVREGLLEGPWVPQGGLHGLGASRRGPAERDEPITDRE